MKRKLTARRGFSLIELLVVLVILALLAGLVVPRFLEQTKRGQRSTAETQISSFRTAIEVYMVDHKGQTPKELEDLLTPSSTGSGDMWKGPYLKDVTSVPLDPWGNPYEYIVPGPAGQDYEIRSLGADGREGGTGDAADISSIK